MDTSKAAFLMKITMQFHVTTLNTINNIFDILCVLIFFNHLLVPPSLSPQNKAILFGALFLIVN